MSILIAGLGNPGKKYTLSRHNFGFLAVDSVASHFSAQLDQTKFNALYGEATVLDQKAYFIKPQTYMNLSGEAVGAFCNFFKIPPSHVIILHDEVDLEFGDIRHKAKGGTAGHNGLASIAEHLGTLEFHRIRLGVGRSKNPEIDTTDHVLSRFTKEEEAQLPECLKTCLEVMQKILAAVGAS